MEKIPSNAALVLMATQYESAREKYLLTPNGERKNLALAVLVKMERALSIALFRAVKTVDVCGYRYASDGTDLYRVPLCRPRRKIRSGPRNRSKGATNA